MEERIPEGRNYQMDELRCLLIFSVVFGHLLELFMGSRGLDRILYLTIYSFHMPLFAFVSGVFAKFDPARIRGRMIYPYLIFQTLYICYANIVLGKETDLQYTTPYWLLWYLFATVAWNLALPLVQARNMKAKAAMLLMAFAAAVMIGYDNRAGYYLSVSRIVEFFPFFLMGYYSRGMRESTKRLIGAVQSHRLKIFLAAFCTLFICLAVGVISSNEEDIRSVWLYGSSSYDNGDYGWRLRSVCMAVATAWLGFFLAVIPVKRVPFLSAAGAHTMTVYLLHGFFIRLLKEERFFSKMENPVMAAFLVTCALIAVLSAKPIQKLFGPFLSLEEGRRALGRLRAAGAESRRCMECAVRLRARWSRRGRPG